MTTTRRLAAILAADVATKTADQAIEPTRAKSVHGTYQTWDRGALMSVCWSEADMLPITHMRNGWKYFGGADR